MKTLVSQAFLNPTFLFSNQDYQSLLDDVIIAGYPLGKNISASIFKTIKRKCQSLAGYGSA